MLNRRTIAAVAAGAIALGLTACGGDSDDATTEAAAGSGPTKVNVRLDWIPSALHAPIYYAKSAGLYERAGLEVDVKPGSGSVTTAQLVGSGKEQFGLASADTAMISRSQGTPVRVAAVILQRSPVVLATKADSGIRTPKDLYGRKLGVIPKSTGQQQWLGYANKEDIDISKIKQIPIPGAPAQMLASGQADAVQAFAFNDPLQLETQGMKIHTMPLTGIADQIYGTSIITSDDYAKAHPDVVEAFAEATMQGYRQAFEKPEAALAALHAAVLETKGPYNDRTMEAFPQYVKEADGSLGCPGSSTPERWEAMKRLYTEFGMLKRPVDARELVIDAIRC